MKKYLILPLLILAAETEAAQINLEASDQAKLAYIVGKLPTTVRAKLIFQTSDPVGGYTVQSIFPNTPSPFVISCSSTYYNNSYYPSKNTCRVDVDLKDPAIELKGDEYRFVASKLNWNGPLFDAIPYGTPKKQMYSDNYTEGINFEGIYGIIFNYHFNCTETDCEIRFAKEFVKSED